MCWRRRIRSVGRACREQGSNSTDSSSEASRLLGRGAHPGRLGERRLRVVHPGVGQQAAHVLLGRQLQHPQGVRGPAGAGEGGEGLVQGELVGAARAGEQPQAPHLRQQRRQLPRSGQAPPAARPPGIQRGPQDAPAHIPVPRVLRRAAGPAGRRQAQLRGAHPVARQGALHERVRRQHPAVAAQGGRQDEVGEPHQTGVVLDEHGLRLFDVDGCRWPGDCSLLLHVLRTSEWCDGHFTRPG
ncbi:hypothetical protein GCM10020000_58300 [Streptomyces olivoverticillatus]